MMPPINDQDLLARFNRRDPDAIARIYKIYYSFVYTVVKRRTSDSSDIKDIVSDSFFKLIRYKGQFAGLLKIKLFLFVTAKTTCLDYQKHFSMAIENKKKIEQEELNAEFKNAEEAGEMIAEYRKLIFDSIQSLPRQCKKVFFLYYFNELRNSEIALKLGITEKTVANQKNIAKNILKIKILKLKNHLFPSITFFLCYLL